MFPVALFLVALILFLLASFNVPNGVRVNLVALGLAFMTAAMIMASLHPA
jgi:hypothetical protein